MRAAIDLQLAEDTNGYMRVSTVESRCAKRANRAHQHEMCSPVHCSTPPYRWTAPMPALLHVLLRMPCEHSRQTAGCHGLLDVGPQFRECGSRRRRRAAVGKGVGKNLWYTVLPGSTESYKTL